MTAYSLQVFTMLFLLFVGQANATVTNYSNTVSTPIPDSTGTVCVAPLNHEITISDSYLITDIDVGYIIEHAFADDLVITLESPAATIVTLSNTIGFEDFNVRFNDEAAAYALQSGTHDANNPYFDVETTLAESLPPPTEFLSDFDGENVNGVWTLTICDTFTRGSPDDGGTILEFNLHIEGASVTDPMIVTSTADTNTIGTLRYAINHANSEPSDDNITFDIPGAGPHIITVSSSLPTISDSGITIDGLSQSGASCGQLTTGTQHTLMLQLNSNGPNIQIFNISGTFITLKGFSLTNASSQAINSISSASDILVECMYVGVAPDGVTKGPNASQGRINPAIRFFNTDNVIVRNSLISGNDTRVTNDGLRFDGVSNGVIQGNIIGLTASGTVELGNADEGILIDSGSSEITVGGDTPETRNIISGNGGEGVYLVENSNVLNFIYGNYIGLNYDGTAAIGNGGNGITLSDDSSAAIYSNSIFGNAGIGIDLNEDGVSFNDSGDTDTGANALLNFPVLNSFGTDGANSIEYDFNLDVPSHPNGYRIDFYKNTIADPTGYGEGEIHLGFVDIAHSGGDLNFSGSFTAEATVSTNEIITATTTRKTGALTYDITSEFSLKGMAISSLAPAALNTTKTVEPLTLGGYALPGQDMIYTFTVTNTGEGSVDTDSITIIDNITSEIEFFNGDYDGAGPSTDRVGFSETGAGVTFNANVDAAFSDAVAKPSSFAACNYTPTTGYDSAVTFICLNPKGEMAGGDPHPTFDLSFRVRIK